MSLRLRHYAILLCGLCIGCTENPSPKDPAAPRGSADRGMRSKSAMQQSAVAVSQEKSHSQGMEARHSTDLTDPQPNELEMADVPSTQDDENGDWTDAPNFFAQPNVSAPQKVTTERSVDHDDVRLVGFVQNESESTRRALLKIGDHMVTVGVGDVVDDVEVLDIDQRTVTIQRSRERWNIALLDSSKPSTNKGMAKKSQSGNLVRNRNNAKLTSRTSDFIDKVDSDPIVDRPAVTLDAIELPMPVVPTLPVVGKLPLSE